MRIVCLFLCLSVAVFGEDWTVNGKDYHNVKVTSVADDSVAVTYDGGIGHFNLSDLTPELKKRFNYDPVKVASAIQKKDEDQQAATQSYASVDEERDEIQSQEQAEIAQAAAVEAARETRIAQQSHYSSHGGTAPVPVYSSAPSGLGTEEIEAQKEKQEEESKRVADQIYQNRMRVIAGIMPDLQKLFSNEQIKNFTKAVTQNQICVGMPKVLVLLAWGNPDSDSTSTSGDGDDWESLDYGNFSSMVFLDGGIVKNITQTQTSTSFMPAPPRAVDSLQAVGGG